MTELQPEEVDLLGKWERVDDRVVADETCDRIKRLTSGVLERIAGGGWEILYRDPSDGRYWELTYPEGQMHGGGPPRLTYVSEPQARVKYGGDISKT
jgi:hypothetical protein